MWRQVEKDFENAEEVRSVSGREGEVVVKKIIQVLSMSY